MPRRIVKIPHDGYKVEDVLGHTYSKKPQTYKKALSQMRAIALSEKMKHYGGNSAVYNPRGQSEQNLRNLCRD